MATTIIFLIISVIALMASVVALVLALQAKKEADEAKKLCEHNAMMIAQVLKETKIKPAEGWMNLAGGILGGAVRGFLAGGF